MITSNCKDCVHCADFVRVGAMGPNDEWRLLCAHPFLGELASQNNKVRCNETREFKFACGLEAKWFEPSKATTEADRQAEIRAVAFP